MEKWAEERLQEIINMYGAENVRLAVAELSGKTEEPGLTVKFDLQGADKMKSDIEVLTAVAAAFNEQLGAMGREIEIKVSRPIPLDWFPVVNPLTVQDTINRLDERRAFLAEKQSAREQAFRGYRKAEADVELARAEAAMNIPAEHNKNDQGRKAWEKKSASKEIEVLAGMQDAKDCAESDYGFALDDLRAVEAKAELQAAVLKYLAGGLK